MNRDTANDEVRLCCCRHEFSVCPAVEPVQVGLVGTAAGSTRVMSGGADPGNMACGGCLVVISAYFVCRDSARCVAMRVACQCAEECLTYEAEDRSTVDEIEEWLDEIVEDVRGSDSDFESLLEDIIPVKGAPSAVKAAPTSSRARRLTKVKLGLQARGKAARARAGSDALLESIRAYNKQSEGGKGSPRFARPTKKRPFRAQARGKSPRPDADETVARQQNTENSVPPLPEFAPKFARKYVLGKRKHDDIHC